MKTLLLTGATGFVGSNMLFQEVLRGTRILAPVRNAEKLLRQLKAEGISGADVAALNTDPSTWGDIVGSKVSRGKANMLGKAGEKWESGLTRGPANQLK